MLFFCEEVLLVVLRGPFMQGAADVLPRLDEHLVEAKLNRRAVSERKRECGAFPVAPRKVWLVAFSPSVTISSRAFAGLMSSINTKLGKVYVYGRPKRA